MDHEALVEALKEPSAYPHPVATVEFVQTHISSVFLTGDYVYKLKKPVNFGFLDFTSLKKRRHFCQEELRLNSRLAPSTYLKVEPVTLSCGRVALGGEGEVVDYAVVMRQMDLSRMGPEVLKRGELNQGLIEQLVEILVPFYQKAATGGEIDALGRVEAVKFNTDENFAQTADYQGVCLSEERFGQIKAFTDRFYEERADLFARRITEGRIRECHGDLHLANICFEDEPVIFDGIEFNERFRYSDVAADLAFLAMDLDFNGLADLSRHLVETYTARSGDRELVQLIDFYKCYRAYVRGKIHSFTWDDEAVRGQAKADNLKAAKRYFTLAHAYAQGASAPVLVVVHGLMGTGKSALGRWLFGAYGWLLIRSDVVRKKLAGLTEATPVHDPYNQGLYSPRMSAKTYAEMFCQAQGFLEAGVSVILDASFKNPKERAEAAELARRTGARLLFIKTVCAPDEQQRRLAGRQPGREASDGRLELMAAQGRDFEPPGPAEEGRLLTIATDGHKTATQALAHSGLKEQGLV